MKRLVPIAELSVALGIVASVLYIYYPRKISVTIKSIQYQLGTNRHVKPVTVKVIGSLRRSLMGLPIFHGTFDIIGASVPNPDNQRP